MHEHVTLLPPVARPDDAGPSSSLPADLLEQVRGRVRLLAMLILNLLLTGELVFTADTSMALLLHHVHTPPPPPSARAEQPIPPALDQLVLSCLAKNPAERPQSARELSSRLGEISGAGAWTEDQARQWWSRHQPARV